MDAPPLTLFGPRADPGAVLQVLLELGGLRMKRQGDTWTVAESRWSTPPMRIHRIVVRHERDYYAGEGWPRQLAGMKRYFASTGAPPEIMAIIDSFCFAITFPGSPLPTTAHDPLHDVLRRIATRLDGVFFVPGYLFDAQGRMLWGLGMGAPVAIGLDDDDADEVPNPPDAERVARRALVLAALSHRGLGELEAPDEVKGEIRRRILAWVRACNLEDELEPAERAFLESDTAPPRQAILDAVWRIEGLAVLCWALGIGPRPHYDRLSSPRELWTALNLLGDPSLARAQVQAAILRPAAELEALNRQLLAVHWRMREHQLRARKVDFAAFSRDCWFGGFSLDEFTLVDGDLALEGVPVTAADAETVGRTKSSALERHLASNWLAGWSAVYSETDTGT